MKKSIYTLLVVLSISLSTMAAMAEMNVPALFFSYSRVYDGVACQNQVNKTWVDETKNKVQTFNDLWNKESPALFQELYKIMPYHFARKELTATLSVCYKLPSFNNPLVINITPLLQSFSDEAAKVIYSDAAFVDLVFHEMLHTWLKENFATSPLMKKYRLENAETIIHLHLMAIQQYIYTKLGKTDMVDWITKRYSSMSPVYQRAWEIVQLEGHQKFIADMLPINKQ